MRAFVDSDHAGDTITRRRSRTGFMVFLNCSPIHWFSKKQGSSCETSSFGSKFCAVKTCCEYIRGLRYKLRMMGIPVENPTYISLVIINQSLLLIYPSHILNERRKVPQLPFTTSLKELLATSGVQLTWILIWILQICLLSHYLEGRNEADLHLIFCTLWDSKSYVLAVD